GAWSSCSDEHIVFNLQDDNGIVDSSIAFRVVRSSSPADTTWLGIESIGISISGSSTNRVITYTPPVPFSDGETVYVCVTDAEDILHNPLSFPLCWEFYMDLESPYVFGGVPGLGSVVPWHSPEVRFCIGDSGSGVDWDSVVVGVDGIGYDLVSDSGGCFVWRASDYSIEFSGGDTVDVCVHAIDEIDYCDDNVLDSCWWFLIESGGPLAEGRRAFGFSSCLWEYVRVWLYDSDGVDTTSVDVRVDGVDFNIYADELWYNYGDSCLYYVPSVGFGDGDSVRVELLSASDIFGNPLETPLSWYFVIDRSSPVITGIVPSPGDTVGDISPDILFVVRDGV
ncbi:MAG: hypothetical protein ACPL6C_04825, partial [bacterium]